MAEILTTRYIVKPAAYDDSPFADTWSFCLEVIRRNAPLAGEPEEWSVSPQAFSQYGYTLTGKQVSLRGVDKLNRRHAVFDLDTALQLARDLVDGTLTTREYTPLVVAAAQFRAHQDAVNAHAATQSTQAAEATEGGQP